MSIQLPEARLFKVLLQDVSTRRQHVSISGSGWAASRALKRRKWLSWVGEEGGQGRRNSRGLCFLLFPGTFPTPDGCQAPADRCAEVAVVPRLGDGSVQGGCSGESHR